MDISVGETIVQIEAIEAPSKSENVARLKFLTDKLVESKDKKDE